MRPPRKVPRSTQELLKGPFVLVAGVESETAAILQEKLSPRRGVFAGLGAAAVRQGVGNDGRPHLCSHRGVCVGLEPTNQPGLT